MPERVGNFLVPDEVAEDLRAAFGAQDSRMPDLETAKTTRRRPRKVKAGDYLETLRREDAQDMTVAEFRLIHGDPLGDLPEGAMVVA